MEPKRSATSPSPREASSLVCARLLQFEPLDGKALHFLGCDAWLPQDQSCSWREACCKTLQCKGLSTHLGSVVRQGHWPQKFLVLFWESVFSYPSVSVLAQLCCQALHLNYLRVACSSKNSHGSSIMT